MPKTTKYLGLRVPPELMERIKEAAWRAKLTKQAWCVEAFEKHISKSEKKAAEEVNGPSVRAALRKSTGR